MNPMSVGVFMSSGQQGFEECKEFNEGDICGKKYRTI